MTSRQEKQLRLNGACAAHIAFHLHLPGLTGKTTGVLTVSNGSLGHQGDESGNIMYMCIYLYIDM